MKAHKNFSIAAAIFMALTVITGFHKATRKSHAVWAILMLICFIGAIASGHKMIAPKREDIADTPDSAEETKG